MLGLECITRKALEKLLGLLVHPLGHRRELMAILDKVYEWVKKLKPLKKTPIPVQIREELMFMFICWPFVHSNVRWPISGTLAATDATTQTTASVSSEVPVDLAHALYRFVSTGIRCLLTLRQPTCVAPTLLLTKSLLG